MSTSERSQTSGPAQELLHLQQKGAGRGKEQSFWQGAVLLLRCCQLAQGLSCAVIDTQLVTQLVSSPLHC